MRRMLLTITVLCAYAVAGAAQQPLAAQFDGPRFEVASIKPITTMRISQNLIPRAQPGGRFSAALASVADLLWFAYGMRTDLIVGGPDWARQDRFEISAKAENDAPVAEIKLMVQSLLRDPSHNRAGHYGHRRHRTDRPLLFHHPFSGQDPHRSWH